ncbi:MAG: BMP family ABC transporter substrate-binding protein [Anaerolineae bacterium]|nr:BMP family ABC transporter substrate-binding protein [Anaerolineae bacterium]NUQ05031.1 BMP family ABC transporter substrate-binding protein [Anaerolineae bacterium]
MSKLHLLVLTSVILLLGIVSAAAQESTVESVCLVTDVGKINDGTFNQFAYEGMLTAAEEYDLETTFIETAAQTDYAANIDTCISEGFDIVVTVGFLIADATLAAAQENPEVYFIGVDQFVFEGPANYVGIQGREDQSAFLVGALAAMVTESNVIGGVFGIDIPPVVRFRNGYEQGIQYMASLLGKEVSILGVYIDSFTAPDRGAAAAQQFIGEGVDVLFGGGGPTGSGAIAAAAAEGIYVIGVDKDEYFTTFGAGETPGADRIISSGIKRVDVGVRDMVAALADGTLVTGVNPNTAEIETSIEDILEASEAEIDLSALP